MRLHTTTLTTPVGPFTLLVGDDGVCAAGFTGDPGALQRRLDPARRAASARPAADPGGVGTAVRAYLAGELEALDGVAVSQPGDPARQAAWRALRSVPAGTTISYRQLGALTKLAHDQDHGIPEGDQAGRHGHAQASLGGLADAATDPLGAQAAGAACAGNHVAVIVPCHRVLRADGGLGGYGWGLPRKRWLLGHEAALAALPGLAAV